MAGIWHEASCQACVMKSTSQVLERRKIASEAWFTGHVARLTAHVRQGRPEEELAVLEAGDAAEAAELAASGTESLSQVDLDLPGAHCTRVPKLGSVIPKKALEGLCSPFWPFGLPSTACLDVVASQMRRSCCPLPEP